MYLCKVSLNLVYFQWKGLDERVLRLCEVRMRWGGGGGCLKVSSKPWMVLNYYLLPLKYSIHLPYIYIYLYPRIRSRIWFTLPDIYVEHSDPKVARFIIYKNLWEFIQIKSKNKCLIILKYTYLLVLRKLSISELVKLK